ncbi:DNA topoisomerase IB [Pseudomonas stutzeri]|uniref:DNA topoisomerase n=1 Tax=Stutzerimonas stutzeri TaxID=316 RepID=A0A2N8S0K8_STUST|nr:DNA topoisomerase IB [Stutzerimonas stutzeri]MCQ4297374.1 DNA topoisomerase IB [Stutzerimonas stutzeri]PNF80142.1 DNA topoisomerase [Stutzerimonas stutzeri]
MRNDTVMDEPLPLAEGTRPVPVDETSDTGTLLCPTLPPDLHYVDDSQPGIRRKRLRGTFAYFEPNGERIRDDEAIQRINKLAIPPAYRDVWICPDPQGHLQATGRDARGRKQYRYHTRWREIRDSDKYERMLEFGEALPKLRGNLEKHLALPGMPREKVMALVVMLLESTLIRIGNSRYARDNRSYGLTTLRTRHVEVRSTSVRFHFRGKSGVEQEVTLRDRRLARLMRRCMELPGQQLFQYLDEDGQRRGVSSHDVNLYLREMTGRDFTAKDYRTWAGSALALERLRKLDATPESVARQNLLETVKQVASQLGNTPAVCRQCYIHPAILQAFNEGKLGSLRAARKRKWLSAEEVALLTFLRSAAG